MKILQTALLNVNETLTIIKKLKNSVRTQKKASMSEVRYCSETEVYAFYFKNVIHTKRRLALHTSTWLSGKDTLPIKQLHPQQKPPTHSTESHLWFLSHRHSLSSVCFAFQTNCNVKNVKWPLKKFKQEEHT